MWKELLELIFFFVLLCVIQIKLNNKMKSNIYIHCYNGILLITCTIVHDNVRKNSVKRKQKENTEWRKRLLLNTTNNGKAIIVIAELIYSLCGFFEILAVFLIYTFSYGNHFVTFIQ